MMKKVLILLIAVILAVSGMQISLDRHYCGGQLADVRVSVTGKLASCGMENEEPVCPDQQLMKNKCCEDQVAYYSVTSKYFPKYFKLTLPTWSNAFFARPENNSIRGYRYYPKLLSQVFPPGLYSWSAITQPEICVFRI